MKRVLYRRQAERDLLDIVDYVATEGGSVRTALALADGIRERIRKIASLPGTFGRSREELALELRSVAEKPYLILFRYTPHAIEVVRVIHGARDIDAIFKDDYG